MPAKTELRIGGKAVPVSNLDKILYPAVGFTKAQVIDYYIRIAPVLLPHLKDRPLTLKRYPEGVEAEYFYEKECPSHRPPWVATAAIASERNQGHINYCLANDLPTLVWTANLADLELHTSLSLYHDMERPTMVVFDLDPGAPAAILECAQVARWLRALFDGLDLESFIKTSGSKGLQVYVPLNTPVTYDVTKRFARTVAELLERRHPQNVVSSMKKSARTGKVLIDWSQNDLHKTTVCVYSLRAKAYPSVSAPVHWEEVETTIRRRRPQLLDLDHTQVLARAARDGDLFAPVLSLRQRLPALTGAR